MFNLPSMKKGKGARAYITEWTEEEETLLVRLYETMTTVEIAPFFPRRTERAIAAHLSVMRQRAQGGSSQLLPKRKSVHFSKEHDRFIIRHSAEKSLAWIAEQLGRTDNSIRGRGRRLGVRFRKFGDANPRNKYSDEQVRTVRAMRDGDGPKVTFGRIGEALGISEQAAFKLYHYRFTADDKNWVDLLPR